MRRFTLVLLAVALPACSDGEPRYSSSSAQENAAAPGPPPGVSADTWAVMQMSSGAVQNVIEMNELTNQALRGDQAAQWELNRRMAALDAMAGMLQAQAAAGSIRNDVQRGEMAAAWKQAARDDHALGDYYARNRDMARARFHRERAMDFERGARRLDR